MTDEVSFYSPHIVFLTGHGTTPYVRNADGTFSPLEAGTTVSGSFTDVADPVTNTQVIPQLITSLDILSNGNDSFLIWASVCASSDTGGSRALFTLVFDGNPLANISFSLDFASNNGVQSGGTQVALSGIAEGQHTIDLKWQVDGESGPELSIIPASGQHASIMIVHLGG